MWRHKDESTMWGVSNGLGEKQILWSEEETPKVRRFKNSTDSLNDIGSLHRHRVIRKNRFV